MTDDLTAAVARLREDACTPAKVPEKDHVVLVRTADIRTVLAALAAAQQDARRLEWFFSDTEKGAWINEYLRGVHDHWTMDQWRAAIDAAMGEQ